MKKRIGLLGAGVLVVAFACYFTLFRTTARKYDFRLDKVSTGDITMVVTATGTVNPVISVDVGTQVSGIINKLYADFNSVVKEGQVIAQIDPTFLQQAVKDAEANLSKAEAQLADSKRNLAREKVLLDKGLDSQLNYDATLTTNESNSAALKSAQASLDRAKINLAYATIYAPISGVVINRAVNVGQTVAASFSSPTLYTIANDLKKMQVQTTVDESDIGRISIGQEVTFGVDAYPDDKFTGVVSQIRLAPVSVQNVINYTVIINVDNKDLKLMPGMTANVKVVVSSVNSVLRVPNLALRFQPPADLIDSARLAQMRMGAGGDSARGGDRRQKFQAVRDSVLAAHGGKMDPDALMAEVRNVLGIRGSSGGIQEPPRALQPAPPARDNNKYGITQVFPEYQKSSFVVQHQGGRARIWLLNAQGKLDPVFVRTGVTDGRFTEITSQELKDGDQIVMGAVSNDASADQAKSPLTGQGQGGRQGGPGGLR